MTRATETSATNPAAARRAGFVVLVALTVVILVASMGVGSKYVEPGTIVTYLIHPDDSEPLSLIVWASRVPRTVILLVAGTALGAAGAIMQAITRNPLTDPGILGVNSGAALFIVIGAIAFGIHSMTGMIWLAFAGALITSLVVYTVGSSGPSRTNPVRMTLTGVALGAVMSGITMGLLLFHPAVFSMMRSWSAGTTQGQSLSSGLFAIPFVVLGLVVAVSLGRSLDVLALGEAAAQAMGANPARIRLMSLISITLLAGSATAIAGPIGFIGLLAAHVSRLIVGPHQGWITAWSAALAPLILCFSDVVGRVIVAGEMPVGIITAFIGAPVLIIVARRSGVMNL